MLITQINLIINLQPMPIKKFLRERQRWTVFDEYHVIFIHIPKTGGTTIENALFNGRVMFDVGSSHRTAQELSTLCQERGTPFASFYSFAIVRNPYDRLISSYFYAKNGGNGGPNDAERFKPWRKLSFEQFVGRLVHLQERGQSHLIPSHFQPQYRWVTKGGGEYEVKGGDALPELMVSRVGKFEQLQDEMELVCKEVSMDCPPLTHERSSNTNDEKEHIVEIIKASEDLKRAIDSIYHIDFVLFDYPKTLTP